MGFLSRIAVGTGAGKKHKFDLGNSCSGTLDFGEIIPTYTRILDAGDKLNFQQGSFVRLLPMVAPTFSRSMKVKNYYQFVPFASILESFDNMMAGKVLHTANLNYIPTSVPFIQPYAYTIYLLRHAYCQFVHTELDSTGNFVYERFDRADETKLTRGMSGELADLDLGFDPDFAPYYPTAENPQEFPVLGPDVADYSIDVTEMAREALEDPTMTRSFLTFRFNAKGKRLLKIFNSLGYQLDATNDEKLNVLPLFAVFKSYFDIFFPQRYINWTGSHAFKVLDSIKENNYTELFNSGITEEFIAFLDDELGEMFYTYSPDYFSAQLGTTTLESLPIGIGSDGNASVTRTTGYTSGAVAPDFDGEVLLPRTTSPAGSTANSISRWQLLAVNALTKYINKNSVIGQKVSSILGAHGYGTNLDFRDSLSLGKSEYNIQVGDIDATTATDGQPLGDYTGKGLGSGSGDNVEFTSNSIGIFICFTAIVPDLGYVQGIDPTLKAIDKFGFFNKDFDALGMVATRKSDMITESTVSHELRAGYASGSKETFGLLPRYSEWKVKTCNVLMGDLYNNSTKNSLLPYTLDRYIPTEYAPILDQWWSNISNSINWRFCNRFEWMGNLNRIFVDYSLLSPDPLSVSPLFKYDHFIIHTINNMSVWSDKLPLSDSFDTDADDKSVLNVEKA